MNLTEAQLADITTSGMDPALLRYSGGDGIAHSLFAPDLGAHTALSELDSVKRHIVPSSRPMKRGRTTLEGIPGRDFQGAISGAEDYYHSFAPHSKVSEYVMSTPEMSGIPAEGQSRKLLRVDVPDMDIIHPEEIPGGKEEFNVTIPEIKSNMESQGFDTTGIESYSDIESLIAGRIFPEEISVIPLSPEHSTSDETDTDQADEEVSPGKKEEEKSDTPLI